MRREADFGVRDKRTRRAAAFGLGGVARGCLGPPATKTVSSGGSCSSARRGGPIASCR